MPTPPAAEKTGVKESGEAEMKVEPKQTEGEIQTGALVITYMQKVFIYWNKLYSVSYVFLT